MLITTIEPLLEAIKDRKDFIHVVKDGYQVIDYVYEDNDSFDNEYRAECRGIKFNLNGVIIARPFRKFFNYGQKLKRYDWATPHKIMTKMDGSMVHTCTINNQLRLMTRMGLTEQALAAESILTDDQREFLRVVTDNNRLTFIFEYIAPDNRIVIDYEHKDLVLLGVRDTFTGAYIDIDFIDSDNVFTHVDTHQFTIDDNNIDEIKETVTGIEGFVVSWSDGTYVKIKTNEYTQMHRAVSFFEREDMILPIILNSQCDDLYPNLSEDRATRLFDFESAVMKEYLAWINDVDEVVATFKKSNNTRKEFALYINANKPKGIRSAYFSALDEKDKKEAVRNCILRNPDLLSVRW